MLFSIGQNEIDEDEVERRAKERLAWKRWKEQRVPWSWNCCLAQELDRDPMGGLRSYFDGIAQRIELEVQGETFFFKNSKIEEVEELLEGICYFPPEEEGDWIRVRLD